MIKRLFPTSRHSVIALLGISLAAFVKLFLNVARHSSFGERDLQLEFLYALATFIISSGWMFAERRRTGESLISLAPVMAAIFWPIGIPIYVIATRKWSGVSKLLVAMSVVSAFAVAGGTLARL